MARLSLPVPRTPPTTARGGLTPSSSPAYAGSVRPGRSKPNPETSEPVSPVDTRSARIRPNVGANLNPCADPSPTTTDGWPGTGASTKSRSGVSVYWQRSDRTAGPLPGSSEPTNAASRSQHLRVRLRRAPVGVDDRAAAVLRGLDRVLAVAGEPVVRRLVHPDPQREVAVRRGVGRREVGRLLERHRQRDLDPEPGEHLVRPGVGGDDDPATGVRRVPGLHHDVRAVVGQPGDRRRADQGRRRRRLASRCIAAVPRAAGTIAPRSWNRPSVPARRMELRPAPTDLRRRRAPRSRSRPRAATRRSRPGGSRSRAGTGRARRPR